MGLFDSIKKKEKPERRGDVQGKIRREVDVIPLEEDEIAKTINTPSIRYVRKLVITGFSDLGKVSQELQEGNIVLVDLSTLQKKPEAVSKIIEQLKGMTRAMSGSVAVVCKERLKLIVTPPDIKISTGLERTSK